MARRITNAIRCSLLCQLLLITSSISASESDLGRFEWMLGNGTMEREGRSTIVEHWKRVSPLTFEGFGATRSEEGDPA